MSPGGTTPVPLRDGRSPPYPFPFGFGLPRPDKVRAGGARGGPLVPLPRASSPGGCAGPIL